MVKWYVTNYQLGRVIDTGFCHDVLIVSVYRSLKSFYHSPAYDISKAVPENCLDGLNKVMAEAWQMSVDRVKRERMQALSLAKECYAMKLDLLSSATVVDRAVKFVDRNKGSMSQKEGLTLDNDTTNRL